MDQEGQDSGLADVDSSHEGRLAAVDEKQETDGYITVGGQVLMRRKDVKRRGSRAQLYLGLPANVRVELYPDRWVMGDVQQGW
jgi:hypothetical protein